MAALPPGIPASNLVLMLQTTASPPLYTAIANLGDFAGPGQTSTIVDTSKHGDKFRRKVKTLLDSGTFTAPVWWDPSLPTHAGNAQALDELYQNQTALPTWLVALVDDSGIITEAQFTFNGYVTKLAWKFPVAGVESADFEITIDGGVNYLWTTTSIPAGQAIP